MTKEGHSSSGAESAAQGTNSLAATEAEPSAASGGAHDAILGIPVPGPLTQNAISSLPLHHATSALVGMFAFALAEKLAKAEQKYGYSDGWRTEEWEAECRLQLHHHAAKGDPLDVAAYAAFCWFRGWSSSHPSSEAPPSGCERSEQAAPATDDPQ